MHLSREGGERRLRDVQARTLRASTHVTMVGTLGGYRARSPLEKEREGRGGGAVEGCGGGELEREGGGGELGEVGDVECGRGGGEEPAA